MFPAFQFHFSFFIFRSSFFILSRANEE